MLGDKFPKENVLKSAQKVFAAPSAPQNPLFQFPPGRWTPPLEGCPPKITLVYWSDLKEG